MGRKKKKLYAVAKGQLPGIYDFWFNEHGLIGAYDVVSGFQSARYKGFENRSDAENFMRDNGAAEFARILRQVPVSEWIKWSQSTESSAPGSSVDSASPKASIKTESSHTEPESNVVEHEQFRTNIEKSNPPLRPFSAEWPPFDQLPDANKQKYESSRAVYMAERTTAMHDELERVFFPGGEYSLANWQRMVRYLGGKVTTRANECREQLSSLRVDVDKFVSFARMSRLNPDRSINKPCPIKLWPASQDRHFFTSDGEYAVAVASAILQSLLPGWSASSADEEGSADEDDSYEPPEFEPPPSTFASQWPAYKDLSQPEHRDKLRLYNLGAQAYSRKRTEAMAGEIQKFFFPEDHYTLTNWQRLVRFLDVQPGASIDECRQRLRPVCVNLFDLVETVRLNQQTHASPDSPRYLVKTWSPSEWRDFVNYTWQGRMYSIDVASNHPILRCLLQNLRAGRPHSPIHSPDNESANKPHQYNRANGLQKRTWSSDNGIEYEQSASKRSKLNSSPIVEEEPTYQDSDDSPWDGSDSDGPADDDVV